MKSNKAAKLPAKSSEQIKVDMKKLDSVIRRALTEGFDHPCVVLGVLGQRFAVPSKSQGFPFYRVLADCGKDGLKAVFVSCFYEGEMRTSINDVSKSNKMVKTLLARIERRTARDAAKLAGTKVAVKAVSK